MAYDEELAVRIKGILGEQPETYEEKKMFGGVAYMMNGNMAIGITKQDLMVRVAPEKFEAVIQEPNARAVEMSSGVVMKNFVFVDPNGTGSDEGLAHWVGRSLTYARTLPVKEAKPKKPKAKR
jgi:TfoX/Sxy family transcriptional regulator of competence genes